MRLRLRPQVLSVIEAGLIGVFFIQALRFLIGMMYSRVAGAAAVSVSDPASITPGMPGVVDPATISGELTFMVYMLLLPLLAVFLGRARPLMLVAAALVAIGRASMIAQTDAGSTIAASLTVGSGLLYIAMLIRYRARLFPYFFILGLGVDQLFRAVGNTLDPSWFQNTVVLDLGDTGIRLTYLQLQFALSFVTVLISIFTVISELRKKQTEQSAVSPDQGLLPLWGGMGLGGLLFLQLSLFALPNVVAGRANVDYTTFVPLVMAATVLPLVPWIRARARSFIALFDGTVRGWTWMLLIALLVVFGTRFPGIAGGACLVVAQFALSMTWWWLVRPKAEKERSFTGLWVLLAVVIFGILAAGDFFSYEYAFVRDLTGNFAFLNTIIPPLLRGFRGMGLGVVLLAIFLATIPMTQTPRRIPWAEPRQTPTQSLLMVAVVALLSIGAALAARPPLVQGVRGVDSFRVGTYNIHAGANEFFAFDLDSTARTIQQSGADVVMLQEVEAGRMTSFGVDQPLWLARRLGMDRRFFPTNEGLQGLATLSRVPIVFHQGTLLSSLGSQTGVQHVQVSTDGGVSAVAFYNTWLGLLLDLRGDRSVEQQEQDQQRQLGEIFTTIARDYPELAQVRVVVGGTFNNVPGSPLIEQMRVSGFTDPFAGLPEELSATLWRTNTRARFDYLWARNVQPLGAVVMESAASDHRMAVVEILINRRPQ